MTLREFFTKRLRYLGLVGFCILVVFVGPDTIVRALKDAEPEYVILALLLNIPLVSLKALRWCLLMRAVGIRVAPWTGLRVYFASLFVGFLTPGRVGELVKAAYVSSKTDEKLRRTLPSAIIDRLLDLYVLVAIGTVGLVRYSVAERAEMIRVLLVVALLLIVPLLTGGIRKLLKRLKGSDLAAGLRKRIPDAVLEAVDQSAALTPSVMLICVGITVLAYLLFFFQCQTGAWAVHVHIPFPDMILVMSVTSLVSLIPVSVAGIGVRDASLVVLLGKIGVSSGQALAFSLMVLIVSYIGGGLIGAFCWWWEPIEIGASARQEISAPSRSGQSDHEF